MRRAVSLLLVLVLVLAAVPGASPASAADRPVEVPGDRPAAASVPTWVTLLRWLEPAALLGALGAGLDPFGFFSGDPAPPEAGGSGSSSSEGELGAGLDPFG